MNQACGWRLEVPVALILSLSKDEGASRRRDYPSAPSIRIGLRPP